MYIVRISYIIKQIRQNHGQCLDLLAESAIAMTLLLTKTKEPTSGSVFKALHIRKYR